MSIKLIVEAMNCKVGSPLRKLVLIKLADNANDDGECWPSYQYIADHCETSRSTVKSHVRELEKMGLLTREFRRVGERNQSNVFTLNLGKNSGAASDRGGHNLTEGGAASDRGGGAASDPRTYNSLEPINEPSCPYQAIVDAYHETLPSLPSVRLITSQRKAAMRARWKTSEHTQSLGWWKDYFAVCASSPFLMGNNERGWIADFDFLMKESKFAKIVEGGYQGAANERRG